MWLATDYDWAENNQSSLALRQLLCGYKINNKELEIVSFEHSVESSIFLTKMKNGTVALMGSYKEFLLTIVEVYSYLIVWIGWKSHLFYSMKVTRRVTPR